MRKSRKTESPKRKERREVPDREKVKRMQLAIIDRALKTLREPIVWPRD